MFEPVTAHHASFCVEKWDQLKFRLEGHPVVKTDCADFETLCHISSSG